METNFDCSNVVIIQFPRFAGGKFITNCLALSRGCVPQHHDMAGYLLTNPNDYSYRLRCVNNTLPQINDMSSWIDQYELGDNQLFGPAHVQWRQGDQDRARVNIVTSCLSNSDLKFFIVCHSGPDEILKLLAVWPNAKLILLTNHLKFREISHRLKGGTGSLDHHAGNYCYSKFELLRGPDWPSWQEFEICNFDTRKLHGYRDEIIEEVNQFYHWHLIDQQPLIFDIDPCIFDRDNFLTSIQNLYQFLGLDDFNPQLIGSFWQSYMDLHVDNQTEQ